MPANYLDLANKMLGAAAAIVKVLPVVGGAGDLLEAAQKIVTAAEDAKKNKRLLEELAKDAASEASAVIQAVKSAQGEKANTSEGIKDLLRVYGEVEVLCRQLGRRRPFIASMCNAGSDTEAIDDMRKQLKDARERYMLTTMARTDHRLDQLRDAADDVRLKDGLKPLLEGRFDHVNSPSGCMPGTREETLKILMDWASFDPDQFGVYWLTGMAGTGKTTIAKSFCTMLAKTTMCSTFFISRNDDNRRNHQNFIPTIAYGLARQHRDIYDGVIAALKQEPDIWHRPMEEQVKALITEPIGDRRVIIVIDALDECQKIQSAATLIQTLTDGLRQSHVKMLVTSRPEKAIVDAFDQVLAQTLTRRNVEDAVVASDIRLFYERSFADIGREQGLAVNWHSSEDLDVLTERAGPLFIYAATLVKFIGDERGDPESRLREWIDRENSLAETEPAAEHLDKLYVQVLQAAVTNSSGHPNAGYKTRIEQLVSTIVISQTPLSLRALTRLLEANEREVRSDVRALSSVVSFSDDGPIQIFHPSFADFVLSRKRCEKADSPVYFEVGPRHAWLTTSCLSIMNEALYRNMCSLESTSLLNSEVPDLQDRVSRAFSEELRYACIHWMHHCTLMDGFGQPTLYSQLYVFCDTHLAHWMECLSLLGEYGYALKNLPEVLRSLQTNGHQAIHDSQGQVVIDYLTDALRATQRFWDCLVQAPLQLYITLIMFLPKCRLLGQLQDIEDSHRCTLISSRASRWGPTAQIIPGGEAPLMSVVVTKDGKFILAGSQDMVLRRWNARTGALLVTSAAQPHGDQDWSGLHLLALSSDESRVVSASCEVMLRVWDANSLDVLSTFEQHTQPVHAMSTISENRVVSGDWAGTIHVWDLITGSIHTSIQLADSIHTFACSPDSQTLAYGGDYIVTLRDLRSGHKIRTLPMPWEKVRDDPYKWLPETPEDGAWMAITFSSDGAYVCCSDPHEGHIWRWLARTGDLLDIISGPINMDAMHYTLDRSTIILRSTIPPRAIRIYNIEQNVVTGSLRVGDTTITPLDAAFLAVGDSSNYLVTPCTDGCIRIWELGSVYQEPVPNGGHGGFPVNNLKFASEGELVISIAGGRNKSGLRFWNAYSGLDCTRCPWDMDDRVSETFELGDKYHFLTIDENHARIWDWSTAEIIRTWKRNPNHLGWFSPSAISPDNAYLAVIQTTLKPYRGVQVTIYRVETGQVLSTWHTPMPKGVLVWSLAFDSGTWDLIGRSEDHVVIAVWSATEHYPFILSSPRTVVQILPSPLEFFGEKSGWLKAKDAQRIHNPIRLLCWVPPELRWVNNTKSSDQITSLASHGSRVAFGSLGGTVTILDFSTQLSGLS